MVKLIDWVLCRKRNKKPRKEIIDEYTYFYTLSYEDIAAKLETSLENGLTSDEVARRKGIYGPNRLNQKSGPSFFKILFHHLFNFMSFVLFAAFVLAMVTLQYIDGGVIAFIIVINTVIGVSQEWKSQKTMEALKKMSSPTSRVIRDGQEGAVQIPSDELVPGDIVILKQGDKVPADIRLFEVTYLECDEALLTGESIPVKKKIEALEEEDTPLGDRKNVVFMSSVVSKGAGKGIVVRTGQKTQLGRIADSVSTAKKQKTQLEKKMTWLGVILAVIAVIGIGLVLLGLWVHDTMALYPEGLQVGVTTAVALIPEALVPVITLTLTLGVRRMAKQNAIVRKLNALEQLGNITDICSDKTGTLTQGKMVATNLWLPPNLTYCCTGKGFNPNSGGIFVQEPDGGQGEATTPEGSLACAMLICSLCNSSTVYRKLIEDNGKKKVPWWRFWARCGGKKKVSNNDKEQDNVEAKMEEEDEERGPERKELNEDEKEVYDGREDEAGEADAVDEKNYEWVAEGSPTEAALLVLGRKAGFHPRRMLEQGWTKQTEFLFDSTVKMMSVAYEYDKSRDEEGFSFPGESFDGSGMILFTKGAPERLLPRCSAYLRADGEIVELSEMVLNHDIKNMNDEMAYQGLRVLALAFRVLPEDFELEVREEAEQELTFVGLVGIKDPPRDGVSESVALAHKAGIKVRMLTGDHPSTSTAIARHIGILSVPIDGDDCEENELVMTSTQFDKMSEEELNDLDELPLVIARCSPESKVKMVQLLHGNDKVVAMTGDGVNDSPAISQANVGISMGISGSDVTKEAADIILTDDDFSTILRAIAEGRRIFANIRKFVVHLLAGNVAEAITLIIGVLVGFHPPIGPLQILWVNLITGTPPAIALGIEPASKDLMDQRKRPIGEALFTTLTIVDIFYYGTVMGALTLGNFVIMEQAFDEDVESAQATSYVTLTLLLLIHAYNCRRLKNSMFTHGFWKAWTFHLSFILGIGTVTLTLYIPGINDVVFHQGEPGYWGWMLGISAALVFVLASELYKPCRRFVRHFMVKNRFRRQRRKEVRAKTKRRKRRAEAAAKPAPEHELEADEMTDIDSVSAGDIEMMEKGRRERESYEDHDDDDGVSMETEESSVDSC